MTTNKKINLQSTLSGLEKKVKLWREMITKDLRRVYFDDLYYQILC